MTERTASDWMIKGRAILSCKLEIVSDLRVGADEIDAISSAGKSFFALPDNPVVRDCTGKPFIPGSTTKGCMRSVADLLYHADGISKLWDLAKRSWKENGGREGKAKNFLPVCNDESCWVCRVFGRSSSEKYREPTRLRVEDAFMTASSDPVVRAENAIHRLLSKANPRRSEYVPRGTEFGLRLVYTVYRQDDLEHGVPLVLECLHHLEDTGIGGGRSRGAGGIVFKDLTMEWRSIDDYRQGTGGKMLLSASDIRNFISEYWSKKVELKL